MNSSPEASQKLLLSRAQDALRLCRLRGRPVFIGFFNEVEAFALKKHFDSIGCRDFAFFGGHKSAQRVYLAVYCNQTLTEEDFPITAVKFKYRRADRLSHKDFLGALMALGVARDAIGDISVGEGESFVFAENKMADFIKANLYKVGSVGVRAELCVCAGLDFPPETEEKIITVASARLDAVVAALANLSREKTASLILSGLVCVNYSPCTNVSCNLKYGDVLSIRKIGKFIISDNLGVTKKGRTRLSAISYI